jgi:phosphatidylglycerol:prolipoprotein diacylglycerol transferase
MYPKLLDLGPIPIHTYGVLLAAALLSAISLAAYLGEKDGIPKKLVWDLGFVIILSALVGAKLLLVITSLDYYWENPGHLFSIDFLRAGGVYYGGLLGAIAGSAIYLNNNPGVPFIRMADVAAPAIPLGQSIGRLGCFSAGCDYGRPTDLPWGVTFTSEYAQQVVGVPLNIRLHPYQLYESFTTLFLCLLLLWLFRRRRFTGQIFSSYLVLYGILRFFLEFFRGDADRGFLFDGLLSTSQFVSILLVPVALIAYMLLKKRSANVRA